jgi:hypothetical protein
MASGKVAGSDARKKRKVSHFIIAQYRVYIM